MSAKSRLLKYFQANILKELSRDTLSEVAGTHSWQRVVRTLRQEGWEIQTVKTGYILNSVIKLDKEINRETIGGKLRYSILQRDNSTCQRCGKTPQDKIRLEVDHKIPVNWGGTNDIDNLWTLCDICNGGKKDFFSDYNPEQMKEIMSKTSAQARLREFFILNPNKEIPTYQLDIISQIRDWERTIRSIRSSYNMKIAWIRKSKDNPKGAYIYET
jgi:HNH endonuclease